ncbi:MAG: DUF3857 domain-containing transglutaminase family protein [Janthinobacterium lividum]
MPRALPVAVLLAVCSAAYAKDQVPDWVRTAAAQVTPNMPRDTDAVFLLEDTTYTVAPDGSLTRHVRKVIRILRPQGRRFGDLYASFNAGSKLKLMHIWSIGADGKEYAVKDNELTEVGTGEGFELYSDGRARAGKAPGMDVGAVAAVEYEQQIRPYENDIMWVPGEDVPVLRERMTLNLPPGYTFRTSWKGKPKAEAIDAEHGRTVWEVSNQPALTTTEAVPLSPDQLSRAARMDVFYQGPNVAGSYGPMSGDWQSVGEWYERLAKDRNKPDAAITAKAQELVSGEKDFRDRTEAIASFVQTQIRYVAIEIGIGGHQPHSAAEVFHARYGDCKDKATLLSAMLNAVGIRSTWVLVDTSRGVIASESPSLAANHMIAAIELPVDYKPERMYSVVTANSGKRFLIFDPTWEKTPFGQLERELQGSDALLIDGAGSQAIRLPVLKPQQNSISRKAQFALAADGTLTGTVEEQQSGDIARDRRYLFAEGTGKQQQQHLDRETSRDLQAFALDNLHVGNAADLDQPFRLTYSLKVDHFAQPLGGLLAVRPRVLGRESFPVDSKHRELPIDLDKTQQVHDDFTITLPAGFEVDEVPEPVHLDLGFATYNSKTTVEQNVLHYQRTYAVSEIVLPASRYPDVQKLARAIGADEQSNVVLKRGN